MKLKTHSKEATKEKTPETKSELPMNPEYAWQAWEGKKLDINHSIRHRVGFWGGVYRVLKTFFILIERSIKTVAILVLTLSASILFLVGSFYLFTSSFSLKDSPAFQTLGDRIGILYANQIEDEINETEKRMAEEKAIEFKRSEEGILDEGTERESNE